MSGFTVGKSQAQQRIAGDVSDDFSLGWLALLAHAERFDPLAPRFIAANSEPGLLGTEPHCERTQPGT